jgi:hypothetical protein
MSFQFHGWSQKTTFLSERFAVQMDIYDLNIGTNERIFYNLKNETIVKLIIE